MTPLALSVGTSLTLLSTRMVLTNNTVTFAFLVWNLFLAALPLGFAMVLREAVRRDAPAVVLLVVGTCWLGFLPNAPYLVTDLVHLHPRGAAWFWLDLTLLASFAFVGLLLGAVAVLIVDALIRARFGRTAAGAFDIATAMAAGIGVHLGRFARFNTWDLITRPHLVLVDVMRNFHDVRALCFVGAFALLLLSAVAACAPRRAAFAD